MSSSRSLGQASSPGVQRHLSAAEARAQAQQIAFGPVLFQACWVMRKVGMLEAIGRSGAEGLTLEGIAERSKASRYAVKVLTDIAATAGVLWRREGRFGLTKTGHMLAFDDMTGVNMNFVGDVCYRGMEHLGEALSEGRPAGLVEFGTWPTIYEGLRHLPEPAKGSWFAFDHFYSDRSFPEALPHVFASRPRTILDVGGNTGKWALTCLRHDPDVRVVAVDLPGQLRELERAVAAAGFADRLTTVSADMLDAASALPSGADVIWMSQFLDCFAEEEIVAILRKAAAAMTPETRLFVLETFIDRQRFDAAALCLAATSLYFTVMANGNSRMYRAEDFVPLVERAGLRVAEQIDDVGLGHTLLRCAKG